MFIPGNIRGAASKGPGSRLPPKRHNMAVTTQLEITSRFPSLLEGCLGATSPGFLGFACFAQNNRILIQSGCVAFCLPQAGLVCCLRLLALPWRCFVQALGFWASVPCTIEVWVCVGGNIVRRRALLFCRHKCFSKQPSSDLLGLVCFLFQAAGTCLRIGIGSLP